MRVSASVAMLVLAVSLPAAAQQRRPAAVPSRFGMVRGVVYDSLSGAPLARARVFVGGAGATAETDAGGRFRLDSVLPGTQIIHYEHDSLDAIGLTSLAQRVQVVAGRLTIAELTTPSHQTLRRSLCRGQAPSGASDSAIVFGAVRDADTRQRLAGALVRVRWIAVQRQGTQGPIDILRPSRDVSTDSLGNFYVCGVAPGIVLQVQAFADSASTGVVEVLPGERAIVRLDLAVARVRALPDSAGLRRGTAVLRGVVRLDDGQPRPSARVSVDDTPDEVFADGDGRFVLRRLPAGSHMVMARMIGYTAVRRLVHLSARDTVAVEITMRALTVLDTIQVTASANQHPMFEDLMARLRNRVAGQQIIGEELARAPNARSVIQRFVGLRIEGPSTYTFRVFSGISCPVRIFVDGLPSGTEALQSYRNDQLVAVEYFPRGSQAPLFASDDQCGVLLVWTKFMVR